MALAGLEVEEGVQQGAPRGALGGREGSQRGDRVKSSRSGEKAIRRWDGGEENIRTVMLFVLLFGFMN